MPNQTPQYGQQNYQPAQQYARPNLSKTPSPVKPDPPQPQPPYVQVTSTSDECGKIAEDIRLIPFKTWGKSTEPMKTTWGQRGCDQLLCQYWHKKYDVTPFETQCKAASEKFEPSPLGIWGTMPEYAKPLWTQGDCDVKMCGIWKAKYGVVKGKTYGSLPVDFKRLWDDPRLLCTDKI
ncbi:hypothetical protein BASA60_004025 [Batrachochytrium salamandrivorans]|nr:hypothetical protein BASA60_004025 [Batrachochytrium salamandrivorans]